MLLARQHTIEKGKFGSPIDEHDRTSIIYAPIIIIGMEVIYQDASFARPIAEEQRGDNEGRFWLVGRTQDHPKQRRRQ